jgi:hypothetical protein
VSAIAGQKFRPRSLRPGILGLLLILTACTPAPPQPGGNSTVSSPAAPATTAATPSIAAPPGDTDEIGPPQSGDRVISSRIALDWSWPGPGRAFRAAHENPVPLAPPPAAPLPTLYAVGAGQHASASPPYDQLSFRFSGGFPSYDIEFVPELLADGSGLPVPLPGAGAILKVAFRGAQAHTADGTASTVTSAPAPGVGYRALTSFAQAGDFEGVLSYGLGVGRAAATVPETRLRVYEVEKIQQGQHLYVVAIQLDSSAWK